VLNTIVYFQHNSEPQRRENMEVFDAIERRRSIRKYRPSSMPEEDLRRILESARLAPSAHNWQPWRFVVVRDPATIERLAAEGVPRNESFIANAASIVVALANPLLRPAAGPGARPESYWVRRSTDWFKMDTMIAIEHMILTSTSLGYGTCWIGTFEENKIKQMLGIPEELSTIALLAIGAPDEDPKPRPRKDFKEVFCDEKYGIPLAI